MDSTQTVLNIEEVRLFNTEKLEEYIDARYEAGATQDELDALETIYAPRVSEDEINMTEDELNVSEAFEMGIDLEEWLIQEYFEYTHPKERVGGRETRDYFKPECFNDFMHLNLKAGIKRKHILEAAKDSYEYKRNLIHRYKSLNKFSNIPAGFLGMARLQAQEIKAGQRPEDTKQEISCLKTNGGVYA